MIDSIESCDNYPNWRFKDDDDEDDEEGGEVKSESRQWMASDFMWWPK